MKSSFSARGRAPADPAAAPRARSGGVFMPLVNPGGMWRGTRANPHGVDLMRNAPLDAQEPVPALIGGQRISARLPWYRGNRNSAMELESRALCEIVDAELLARDFSITLDCHSGFGVSDRLWFPYAHTRAPLSHLAEIHALKEIFRETHPPPVHFRAAKPSVPGPR